MRDILPEQAQRIRLVEDAFRETLCQYSYQEIRLPIVEQSQLFNRGLGEATDAVAKEMYTFPDRDENEIALRPEGTASAVRAVINGQLYRGANPRLWYQGPMFRSERPQKGRYREFYQIGAEVFGHSEPEIDAELIAICRVAFEKLELENRVSLEINSLGTAASRARFRDALVEYLTPYRDDLDEFSQHRMKTSPLRILDSKNESTQHVLTSAPNLHDYLDKDSMEHFDRLRMRLEELEIPYTVNERLVRGLDYYTHTVFEWNGDGLGAQKQVGGGGRYDGLVKLLGGKDCPASGFAMGLDRIALVHEHCGHSVDSNIADVYVIPIEDDFENYANTIAQRMREVTERRIRKHIGGGRIQKKLRDASRSGAQWAVIVGSEEVDRNTVTVKYLGDEDFQVTVPVEEFPETLPALMPDKDGLI